MKGFSLYFLFMVLSCIACGRINDPDKSVSPKIPTKIRQAIMYDTQRSLFYQKSIPDSSIYFAQLGLQLARKWKYKYGEAIMLGRFATINETYGNDGLAFKYQKQSLTLFKSLKKTSDIAAAYLQLGLIEAKLGQTASGIQSLNTGLLLYNKKGDTLGMCKAYTQLAEVYELNRQQAQALLYYSKAEALNSNRPITDDYFSLLSHLGKLNSNLGNHKKALEYYQLGIAKSDTLKYANAHVTFLHRAGRALDSLGRGKEALSFHRAGLQKAKDFNLKELEARSLLSMAEAVKDEDAQQGIMHLKNALKIAEGLEHKQLTAEIYGSLSDLYKQQSRYSEALTSLEAHHRLIDSLVNVNKAHKISVLQSSYQLAESKVRIENLELINQKRTYERNIGVGIGVAALAILLIVWFYLYKIKRLNRRLAEANAVKDKLFSIIGHDLRNPIGGIAQLLAVMDGGTLSQEETTQMISPMKKQADSTLEILNALLDWGQAQIKGIHVERVVFKPEGSVRKNIEALKKQASDKGIMIINEIDPDLKLEGDPNHFDFIIRNLLSNAIKFSPPKGNILIRAKIQGTKKIIFSVKDEGKGISKEQQGLFINGNMDISYGTKGEKGTGIGLLLSKEFIKSNGGRIWIESQPDKGTTFYFYFKNSTRSV